MRHLHAGHVLVAATELLRRNATPSEAEVEAALGGVLVPLHRLSPHHRCRAASRPMRSWARWARLPRVDGAARLDGTERYGADLAPTDALWLRAIRSQVLKR